MSDGPHRSLPMRRGWKRVAEWADNPAFEVGEVSNAIVPALDQDCKGEMSQEFLSRLCAVYHREETSLFKNNVAPELESLRHIAGPGIGHVVLELAIQMSTDAASEHDIPLKVITDALADRAARCARQVEEHYCRESSRGRAHKVRQGIEQAINTTGFDGLARQILKIESSGSSGRMSQRHDGIDDGVRF
jgi:hypothetical protein